MTWLMHVPEGCPSKLGWVSSLLGVYRIHGHATPFTKKENLFRLNGFCFKKVGLVSCCMPAACRHLILKVYTMRPMLVLHLKTQKQCITDL